MRPGWKICWPIWSDPKGQTFFIWRRALGGCAPNFAIYNSLYNFARKIYKKNVKSGIPDLTSPVRLDQLAYILPLGGVCGGTRTHGSQDGEPLSSRKGVKPFALPIPAVVTSVASCLREGGQQVWCGAVPVAFGLTPLL